MPSPPPPPPPCPGQPDFLLDSMGEKGCRWIKLQWAKMDTRKSDAMVTKKHSKIEARVMSMADPPLSPPQPGHWSAAHRWELDNNTGHIDIIINITATW